MLAVVIVGHFVSGTVAVLLALFGFWTLACATTPSRGTLLA
jgi:hypothetical protein